MFTTEDLNFLWGILSNPDLQKRKRLSKQESLFLLLFQFKIELNDEKKEYKLINF